VLHGCVILLIETVDMHELDLLWNSGFIHGCVILLIETVDMHELDLLWNSGFIQILIDVGLTSAKPLQFFVSLQGGPKK